MTSTGEKKVKVDSEEGRYKWRLERKGVVMNGERRNGEERDVGRTRVGSD